MSNLFEDFQAKKKQLIELTKKAFEFNWITKERYSEILNKIENDILTIGIIGQIKCGKSTFLNAFVFEDDVLPAAITPMTASLTVITYGEKKKIVAEFYTKEEWAEQKLTASRDENEVAGNDKELSKIKAAKDLVKKSSKLGDKVDSFLGKQQEDDFENLIEYVGADGKYISITKSVKVYYPKEYLKGVEIVDTPGMNDPIVSREERTKQFLEKADVVLLMLFAGQPFSSVDHDILFENVRRCGIGKVLIGINKYDIPYIDKEHPSEEEEIKSYVIEEIKKACNKYKDDTISDILNDVDPVLLSANMALLSELPMTRISSNEIYDFDWKRYCEGFEISSQKEFRNKSHIDLLSKQVLDLIENEKGKILFTKPKNEILAAGKNKKYEVEKKIFEAQNVLKVLQTPDNELEEKLENLSRANKRITRKLDGLSSNLEDLLDTDCFPRMRRELEDSVDEACAKMRRAVDEWRMNESFEKIRVDLEKIVKRLASRELPRVIETNSNEIKRALKNAIQDYFADVQEIAGRFISDFDMVDFFESLQTKVIIQAEDEIDSFNIGDVFNKSGEFWSSLTNGWIFTRKSNKAKMLGEITEISSSFSAKTYVNHIQKKKDIVVDNIKKETNDAILKPIQDGVEECKNNKSSREAKIEALSKDCKKFESEKKVINEQMQIIASM